MYYAPAENEGRKCINSSPDNEYWVFFAHNFSLQVAAHQEQGQIDKHRKFLLITSMAKIHPSYIDKSK